MAGNPARPLKTRPWHRDEYIIINGRRLIYTYDFITQDITVLFPGGQALNLNQINRQRYRVRLPKQLRKG